MENIIIRGFEFDKDLELLAAIDAKSEEEYWTLEDFKKKFKQKSITCLVIEKESQTVGFLLYEIFLQRFTILRIGIHAKHRKKGLGSELMTALSNKLTEKRKLIVAEVRESNLPIQLFLKSQGYKAVKVLRKYFPDTGEDAFVFNYRAEAKDAGEVS